MATKPTNPPRKAPPAPPRAAPRPPAPMFWDTPAPPDAAPQAPLAPLPALAAPLPPPAAAMAPVAPPAEPAAMPVATMPGAAPADAAERVKTVASKGGSLKTLHALFGVTADVFKGWMDADPSLRKSFDEGKEQERETLHRTLYEAATYKRDLQAAQFLLKTRHGYREQEAEDTRNIVRIVFNLPAAAPDMKTYVEQNGKRAEVLLPRAPLVLDHE